MAIRFCKGIKDNNFKKILLDENIFINARNILLQEDSKYLSVVDKDNNFLFCCYNDTSGDKILNHIITLSSSKYGLKKLKKFRKVTIISLNELSYNLYLLFKRAGCKVKVLGEHWDMVTKESDITNKINGFGIYSEGNLGLKLSELGFWENAFPYNEYEVIEEIYKKCLKCKKLYDKRWINRTQTNKKIISMINSKKPFMIARLGNTEAAITQEYLYGSYSSKWIDWLYTTSGFFSKNGICLEDINKYSKMTIDAIKNCDIHCCRFQYEIELLNKYSNSTSLCTDWYNLYTDINSNMWLKALKNKKVLIISSISKTIEYQYKNRDNLFSSEAIPNMNIIYYDTPQTQLGNKENYNDWFDAYSKMIKEIEIIDFDIAIIAAGAYGYILASDIKNMGKQAIELCSGIYPIFGIKVNTQAIIRKVSIMYNEHWIFPLENSKLNIDKIEKRAYWE